MKCQRDFPATTNRAGLCQPERDAVASKNNLPTTPPTAGPLQSRRPGLALPLSNRNHALNAEVRQYDTLFATENAEKPPKSGDWHDNLNPDSLTTIENSN